MLARPPLPRPGPRPMTRPTLSERLSPRARRVLQALLYEGIAIACVTPALSAWFDHGAGSTLALSVVMSTIALAWNAGFNTLWERWEARQEDRRRTWRRRLLHGLGFEGGLALILTPVVAAWLDIGLWHAFVTDLVLLLFFAVYTVAFTWAFDRLAGLPASAR